jgi:hypothetical protein
MSHPPSTLEGMKTCRKCGEPKPLLAFYKMPGMRDGHRNDCIRCNLEAQAKRRALDPEANRRRAREWQLANPERVKAKHAEYVADGRKSASNRKSHLKRKYALTIEQYDQMLAKQGGGCAICGRPPRPDISLHVDHDHETGRIRGLLCFRCNNALGDFLDDESLLREAAGYLARAEEDPETAEAIAARVAELIRIRDNRLFA